MEYDAKACAAGVSSVCAWGKKSSGKRANCIKGEGKSRCSCVIRGASCTRKCRCTTCQNKETSKEDKEKKRSTGCRCGMNKKRSFQSCTDIEGQRKTKCPCFRDGSACNLNLCFCKRCKNPFSQFQSLDTEVIKGVTRRRKRHSSYTRVRGEEFLRASDSEASQGPWTKLEGCMIQTIESFLGVLTSVPVTTETVEKLYNFVANSEKAKELGLDLRAKSVKQIQGKMLQVLQRLHFSISFPRASNALQ